MACPVIRRVSTSDYGVRLKDILFRYGRLSLGLWRGDPALTPVATRKADLLNWLSREL